MNAAEWIDRVRSTKGLPSDYAAAKLIGISRFTVSGYRNRPGSTLDEEIAVKVANAIGINPAGIVLDQAAERAKDQGIRATLARLADQLCILCKVPDRKTLKLPRAFSFAAFML